MRFLQGALVNFAHFAKSLSATEGALWKTLVVLCPSSR